MSETSKSEIEKKDRMLKSIGFPLQIEKLR